MNVLLTGFGPFGSVLSNPSERMVEEIRREGIDAHDLTCRVLPVSFARAAKEMVTLLRGGSFDLVLMLGVAERSKELRLERYGRNRSFAGLADVDGFSPEDGPILIEAPGVYEA